MSTFVYTLTVPAATPAYAPVEVTYTLPAGALSSVSVFFPPGPQGEVGIRLLHNRSQFYPSRVGQWIGWDSGAVSSRIGLPLTSGHSDIVIQGKSPDANFDHDIIVKVDVDPASVIFDPLGDVDGIDRVNLLLGGV